MNSAGEGRGTEVEAPEAPSTPELTAPAAQTTSPTGTETTSASTSTRFPTPWTLSQRVVLIALLVMLLGYLGIRLLLNPMYVSDPQPIHPLHEQDLKNRIDPNTADVKTLAALPMIGEKRARDIVAYRERVAAERPGEIAFKRPEDLLRIKGIGRAMVQTIEPFLIFSRSPTSTSQSSN